MIDITVLVNNTMPSELMAEHGLALFFEYQGQRILFDTGQGEALFHNAKCLNIDLNSLDILILSHGHYDHCGNVAAILKMNPTIRVVAHPHCTVPRYSLHENKPVKSVALTTENRAAIISHSTDAISWCFRPTEILSGLWVTGEIPRISTFEDTGGPFYLDQEGRKKDMLPDDIALWVDTGETISVVTGCCHSGIVNTVQYIESYTGKRVRSVLGGLHLVHADETRLERTLEFIRSSAITELTPLHCTGENALQLFSAALPEMVN